MSKEIITSASATDRRSFLKSGALVAAPIVAIAPAAALADDGSRARLARLEDERAIEALHRAFLRRLNGQGAEACGEFLAGADLQLDDGLAALADDPAGDAELVFAEDSRHAHCRRACRAELETRFTGDSTLERMARFQGQGSHRHAEQRVLAAEYVKSDDGWRIAGARFV